MLLSRNRSLSDSREFVLAPRFYIIWMSLYDQDEEQLLVDITSYTPTQSDISSPNLVSSVSVQVSAGNAANINAAASLSSSQSQNGQRYSHRLSESSITPDFTASVSTVPVTMPVTATTSLFDNFAFADLTAIGTFDGRDYSIQKRYTISNSMKAIPRRVHCTSAI
jgi:hypothetical protein